MEMFDAGGIREIIIGTTVAGTCFIAPTLLNYLYPEPTAVHGVVKDLPFLGSLVIGLTFIRLMQRRKHVEKDENDT